MITDYFKKENKYLLYNTTSTNVQDRNNTKYTQQSTQKQKLIINYQIAGSHKHVLAHHTTTCVWTLVTLNELREQHNIVFVGSGSLLILEIAF